MMKKTLLFMSLLACPFIYAQSIVKDINFGPASSMPTYAKNRIAFGGKLIFAANDGASGMELWESDGTNAGTTILGTFATAQLSSNPNGFHIFNNKVYFSAASGSQTKYELRSTDGTFAGIVNYPQIRSGNGSASPRFLTTFGNMLVFNARPSALNQSTPFYGEEIMGFDGNPWTGGGDQIMIKDISLLGNSSSPEFYTEYNGLLYFAASNGAVNSREIWVSDGTTAGTNMLLDINPGTGAASPKDLIVYNNKLYFTADDGTNGRELWVSDGTVAGTQRMNGINPIAGDLANPENLIVFNNALYFTATHPTLGTEIFKLGGTTITNLKNIASGNVNGNPSNLFVSSGRLYFSADDNINGIELWSSTGFSATTSMVKNINTSPSSPDSNPIGFEEYNGRVYFSATDGTNGVELWVTDGTNAGTTMVSNINPSGDSNPTDLIMSNNLLFFSANNGSAGVELWKYQDPALSVTDLELENKIALYPNPTLKWFSIESNLQFNKISVLDIHGKTIKIFDENVKEYNVEDLTSGLYFINIKTEKGKITKKLIKE